MSGIWLRSSFGIRSCGALPARLRGRFEHRVQSGDESWRFSVSTPTFVLASIAVAIGLGLLSFPLRRSADCQSITLASGIRWDELASDQDDGADFLRAVYEVGGASTQDESLMRHPGREYGDVIEGEDEPVEAIWFVLGWDSGSGVH